jgi:hypothetical protein
VSCQSACHINQKTEVAPVLAGSFLQRKCGCNQHTTGGGGCSKCSKNQWLHRATRNSETENQHTSGVPQIVHDVLRSPGQPLDPQTRDFLEPRFGQDLSRVQTRSLPRWYSPARLTVGAPHDEFEQEADAFANRVTSMPAKRGGERYDFSNVRIHTDAQAAESARAVNALAYTVGHDLVFGSGNYKPGTPEGMRLISHELTHVIQQSGADRSLASQSNEQSVQSAIAPKNSIDQDLSFHPTSALGAAIGTVQRQTEVAGSEPESAGTEPAAETEPSAGTEPAAGAELAGVEEHPELSALAYRLSQLIETVNAVTRDNGSPMPGRTTEVGSTNCNPATGRPEWRIDRSRIPQCMWPCAERHEQTHAEFMRMPCETVWLPLERARFWIRIATQYARQGNAAEVERALRESQAAVDEGQRSVQWYVMYMSQTCRYDEGTAYEAGIEVCDTAEIRSRCTALGELDRYNVQMAAWRRFMQNPPNCPAVQPPPPPRP